ncbi:MAG: hypothetical protein V4557_15005 [Bacteroidota bacterium]
MKTIFAGIIALILIAGNSSFAAGDTKNNKQQTEKKVCKTTCSKEKKDCKSCSKTCKPSSCKK